MQEKIVVTCAHPYANGPLHIGHIRSTYLPGDICYRYLKMKGEDVLFICASDEHGTPITVKAEQEKKTPKEVTDKYYKIFKEEFSELGINFSNFARDDSEINWRNAQEFFTEAFDKGFIYEKKVEQYYCEKCSRFLPDRYVEGKCPNCGADGARGDHCESCGKVLDTLKDPYCLICRSKPEIRKTKHWFFKLTAFKKQLSRFLEKRDMTKNVRNYASDWIKKLQDWCITRDLEWGVTIPVEGVEGKVLYVWWDAPIGYVSSTQEWGEKRKKEWKPYWTDGKIIYFIGKDIIYHHALFWPAMLLAHGKYNLPYSIVAGEYLSLEGKKMSTSRNWVLWVSDFLKKYPADYLRYYLTITSPLTSDMDFSWADFQAKINNELSDVLGNFVHRVLVFTDKYFNGKIPKPGEYDSKDENLLAKLGAVPEKIAKHLDNYKFMEALKEVMALARAGNQYLNEKEPWKNPKNGTPIYVTACMLKEIAVLIAPFLPNTSQRIWEQLGFDTNVHEQKWESAKDLIKAGQKIRKPSPLIQKVELEEEKLEFSGKKVVVEEKIENELKERKLSVGLAEVAGFSVQRRSGSLEKLKKQITGKVNKTEVAKTIDTYRYMIGSIDKGTEGLSSENLQEFVKKSKQLPNINTVTDIYNMISYKTGLIMGAYDRNAINGNVILKVASGEEDFVPIGSGKPAKIEPGEYVIADESDKVITRWLTKEHEKVKITNYSKGAIICVQGNKDIPQKKVNEVLKEICELIVEHCGGEYKILYPK